MSDTSLLPQPPRDGDRSADTSPAEDVYTGVISRLVAGPLMLGGIGAGLDRWWNTAFALPVGIVAGMALALYVIWLRYGTT